MDNDIALQSSKADYISQVIELWLLSKYEGSKSKRTKETYRHYITTFRRRLALVGVDLDGLSLAFALPFAQASSQEQEEALKRLSTAAQGWASGSWSEHPKELSASTYNQRLSILSSFYLFVKRRRYIVMDNPIDLLDRREVQVYANARPLSREKVERVISAIDKTTVSGKRDRALFLVFLNTGRRASEVLALRWKHVEMEDDTAILHFERCKGGKTMSDKLDLRTWHALEKYLRAAIHPGLDIDPEQALWLSFATNHLRQPLTQRGLADVFKTHFKTMKIHTMRHTFAHGMKKAGADTRTIQKRLGHSSELTTEQYLVELDSAENAYAEQLMDYYGVEDE